MSRRRNPIIEEDLARICAHDLPWRAFSGKTILISGANGFLPAYMVETLLYLNEIHSLDCQVIGLARNREKAEMRFAHVLGRPDFSLLIQDVCSPVTVNGNPDFIVHAASQASPKYYGKDPAGTLLPNTIGTHNLLCLARKRDVQSFLFFSSGDVYGRPNTAVPVTEDGYGPLDPTDLRSCYGESKRMGETMCVAWHHQYGVPTKMVRPAHTYGPGMALDDGRVFADFVANIVRGEDIVLKSQGTARRVFCYLADATLAFFTVLLHGENAQAYNVANENCEISVRELAEVLVSLFPEKNLTVRFSPDFTQTGYLQSKIEGGVPDTAKIRKLGWNPTTTIEEGFRRTVASFENSSVIGVRSALSPRTAAEK
jgi:nucleoside-diphosphate-sugar epimerase